MLNSLYSILKIAFQLLNEYQWPSHLIILTNIKLISKKY